MKIQNDKHQPRPVSDHKVRNPYSPRLRVSLGNFPPTKAKQEFKDECDINTIMRKYRQTGLFEHVNRYQGSYGDLGEPCDFQTAQNIIIEAREAFESLPAVMRKRFDNNPHDFLEFVHDPANKAEMIEMGLMKKPIQPPQAAQEAPKTTTPNPNPPKTTDSPKDDGGK